SGRRPVGEWVRSPYDRDVRYGRKRAREWIGYRYREWIGYRYQVHLREGGEDELPHLITPVATAPAAQQDHHRSPRAQRHSGRSSRTCAAARPAPAGCGLRERETDAAQPRRLCDWPHWTGSSRPPWASAYAGRRGRLAVHHCLAPRAGDLSPGAA